MMSREGREERSMRGVWVSDCQLTRSAAALVTTMFPQELTIKRVSNRKQHGGNRVLLNNM